MKNTKKLTMKKYYYKCSNIKKCCADELQEFIDNLPDDSVVYFVDKTLFLSKRIIVDNKNNIDFIGRKTKIISKFDPKYGFEKYSGVFSFSNCKNIIIKDFVFDTDKAVNATGKVKNIDAKSKFLDVEILKGCRFEDGSRIFATNSMNRAGSADYAVFSEKPSLYEKLDKNTIRIKYSDELQGDLGNLYSGQKICIRFGTGNYLTLKNSMLIFQNCEDFRIKNIKILSSPGYASVIFPRCSNFYFNRYTVSKRMLDKRLMASNVDALHVFGITGNLTLKNCRFSGLGDDALNIHSTAGTVVDVISNEEIKVKNNRFNINLEKDWCKKGDKLAFYDCNFNLIGYALVEDYSEDTLKIESNISVLKGYIVANTEYYAKTTVKNTYIKNSRARGLLLQTQGVRIKKCRFINISMSAILMAPDIRRWHEVGPCDDVKIEKNIFVNCNFSNRVENTGVITSNDSHDFSSNCVNKMHGEVRIKNNLFIGKSSPIVLKSVKEPIVNNNLFFGKYSKNQA